MIIHPNWQNKIYSRTLENPAINGRNVVNLIKCSILLVFSFLTHSPCIFFHLLSIFEICLLPYQYMVTASLKLIKYWYVFAISFLVCKNELKLNLCATVTTFPYRSYLGCFLKNEFVQFVNISTISHLLRYKATSQWGNFQDFIDLCPSFALKTLFWLISYFPVAWLLWYSRFLLPLKEYRCIYVYDLFQFFLLNLKWCTELDCRFYTFIY